MIALFLLGITSLFGIYLLYKEIKKILNIIIKIEKTKQFYDEKAKFIKELYNL